MRAAYETPDKAIADTAAAKAKDALTDTQREAELNTVSDAAAKIGTSQT